MTFTEIVGRITSRLNISQAASVARIGESVNDVYKNVTTSVGLGTSRRTEVQATATISSQFVTFTGIEKVISVIDKSTGANRFLDEVTVDELDRRVVVSSDTPTAYAVYRANAGSVQIKTNATAQTAYTLYAPGFVQTTTLSGTQEPAFPESFHDLLVSGVLYEEYMKLEKPGLAKVEQDKYVDRLGDLRLFLQTSPQQDIYRSKLAGTTAQIGMSTAGAASGGGSDGTTSYTQTGLITFDRTGAASTAPFAVASGSAKVANLDADLLDGQTGSYYSAAGNLTGDIAAARLAAAFAWTTYTPTWTASSVNPAIGNGTITGAYLQIGKIVWFRLSIGMGASTTFGTGTYAFSLPVASASGVTMIGDGRLFDSGTNNRLVLARRETSTTFALYQDQNTGSGIGPTVPFTFAVSDAIEVQGCYEAA